MSATTGLVCGESVARESRQRYAARLNASIYNAKVIGLNMPQVIRLELLCLHHDDGTIDGELWYDGARVVDPDLVVVKGNCDAIKELFKRARDRFQINPEVGEHCVHCLDTDFLEQEALQPQ